MDPNVERQYQYWLRQTKDPSLKTFDEAQKEDAFYKELVFGTGGLRGILGMGTNRMNLYVVQRATLGIVDFLRHSGSVVIGYDTRKNSFVFANACAAILSAYGIDVFLYDRPYPTPMVSFAIRQKKADLGIMITASHNPAQYNGYKVYDETGTQITETKAQKIYSYMQGHDYFEKLPKCQDKKIHRLGNEMKEAYEQAVLDQRLHIMISDLPIVYTPLHGTGRIPVMDVLKIAGFSSVSLVKEQADEDENFSTCTSPNPEEDSAFSLAIRQAHQDKAELILATDPDCDRIRIAAKEGHNYRLFSANELGCLLLDYIASQTKDLSSCVFLKTIVTSDLAQMIASSYGIKTIQTLTGFKYIGEQIERLDREKKEYFLFGFEESCGFLKGNHVRDKDGVVAALLVCEMTEFYHRQGLTLSQKLEELTSCFGYCLDVQKTIQLPGLEGQRRMEEGMDRFRFEIQSISGREILYKKDYASGIDGLPASNVIQLFFADCGTMILRPSGTEPKLKIYYSLLGKDQDHCLEILKDLHKDVEEMF